MDYPRYAFTDPDGEKREVDSDGFLTTTGITHIGLAKNPYPRSTWRVITLERSEEKARDLVGYARRKEELGVDFDADIAVVSATQI